MDRMSVTSKLFHGNCLKVMKELKQGSVDLIVTDPPFNFHAGGRGLIGKRKVYKRIEKSFETNFNPAPFLKIVPVTMEKFNMFVYCNKAILRPYLNFAEKNGFIWDILIWHKPYPIPSCYNHFVNDIEYCVYIRERGACFTKHLKLNFYRKVHTFSSPSFKGHPTPKPVDLMKRHIILASKKQDIIFDPFMGSGTTGAAAIQLKRSFIGIEINKKFFEMAKERIDCALQQKTILQEMGF